jgi:hypothetical protein
LALAECQAMLGATQDLALASAGHEKLARLGLMCQARLDLVRAVSQSIGVCV